MKCLRALAIVGSLVGSANAAVTPTPLFNGTYEVFGARGTCNPGETIGTIGNVRFRQSVAGSAISLLGPSGSEVRSFFLPNDVFNRTFKSVRSMFLRFDFEPINHPVSVRFVLQRPTAITATTSEIRLIGEVKGLTSSACISVFRATLVRWLQF